VSKSFRAGFESGGRSLQRRIEIGRPLGTEAVADLLRHDGGVIAYLRFAATFVGQEELAEDPRTGIRPRALRPSCDCL
jgi:hypothetical protein